MRTIFIVFVVLALSIGSASCSRSLTPSQEASASMATIRWLDEQYGLVHDRRLSALLSRVTDRISQGVYGRALQREIGDVSTAAFVDYPWQTLVIRSSEPNAFAAGAGAIVLTTGMLRSLGSEAELAAVISHEIAHQLLGHTRQALIRHADVRHSSPISAFSLEQELAADSLALKMMLVARYDVSHALHTLSIPYRPVGDGVSGIPPRWLSLRMSNMEQRIRALGPYLPATASTREFSRVMKRLPRA